MILLPDTEQQAIYDRDIAPNLSQGDARDDALHSSGTRGRREVCVLQPDGEKPRHICKSVLTRGLFAPLG